MAEPRERGPLKIDVKRAVEGARAAGVKIGRIEIDGRRIVIVAVDDENGSAADDCESRMREAFGA